MGAEDITVIKKRKGYSNVDQDKIREAVKSLLERMLGLLLVHPHSVEYEIGDNTTVYFIDLQQEDFGRLVGASGRTIGGIRALAIAISGTYGIRTVISIKDEDRFF